MQARITRIPPNAIQGTWTLERRTAADQPWQIDSSGDSDHEDAAVLRDMAAQEGLTLIEDEADTPVDAPSHDFEPRP